MLNGELTAALNDQMVFEISSAYIYLGMAAALERMNLPGCAHWMRIQADEELIHADIFYRYINDNSAAVELQAIPKPEFDSSGVLAVFKGALKHEKIVTSRIDKLAALAMKNNSFATLNFLNFFVTEQVQEEKSVQEIIDQLELAGNSKEALLFIDNKLAARAAATAPTAAATV